MELTKNTIENIQTSPNDDNFNTIQSINTIENIWN